MAKATSNSLDDLRKALSQPQSTLTQSITPVAGLNRDISTTVSKSNTYFDAMNMVLELGQGNAGKISTELGNIQHSLVDQGYNLIGSIDLQDNNVVLFTATDDNTRSSIYLYNTITGVCTLIIDADCLNFNTARPVRGVFRIRRGCDRVIYFVDDSNPVRSINIDKLDQYRNSDGSWNCDLFSLNRPITYPTVDEITVNNSGGALAVGSYSFVFRLLDDDLNPSNWTFPTTPIYIYDNNVGSGHSDIDGAQNNEFFSAEEGGVPKTNKSITIVLSDIDTRYKFIEIGVIKAISGLSEITNIESLNLLSVNNTIRFVYTGSSGQVRNPLSLAEISIEKEYINNAKAINQVDNQLWLGNVDTIRYDWADFQRAASKIRTTPVVNTTSFLDSTKKGNFLNPSYMQYMGDEIYMLGIVYVMKDGSYSPVFIIPGRSATTLDREILSVWNRDMAFLVSEDDFNNNYAKSELELQQFPSKPVVRRFQVYNTGNRTSRDRGTMAYHESVFNVFPDIRDCEGNSIWGTDAEGNELLGTPIRHHRFPSRRDFPIVENQTLYDPNIEWVQNNFGIEFSEVTYPHGDIVGHIFVRALRTDENKTILDKGWLYGTREGRNLTAWVNSTPTLQRGIGLAKDLAFMSPKMLFEKTLTKGQYFSIEGIFDDALSWQDETGFPIFQSNQQFTINAWRNKYLYRDINTNIPRFNLAYSDSVYVQPFRRQDAFNNFPTLINRARTTPISFYRVIEGNELLISVDEFIDLRDKYKKPVLAANKINNDVYSNLTNILFVSIVDSVIKQPGTSLVLSGGDTVISKMNLVEFNDDLAGISDFGALNEEEWVDSRIFNVITREEIWVESEINTGLRHEGSSLENKYLRPTEPADRVEPYFAKQIANEVETNRWTKKGGGEVNLEYFGYNKDYSYTNKAKPFISLPVNYDYCEKCNNYYPNRIYYSKKDNLETTEDNYRVFLAQNYGNIDGLGSEITSLIVDMDELYCLTKAFVYKIPTKPQELKLDDTIAYLGTGSNLSIPPRRMVSPNFKYGGTSAYMSVVSTEGGTIYVDDQTSKVLMITGGKLDNLGDTSMQQFFEDNIPLQLNLLVTRISGQSYPYLHTTHRLGIGFIATYDPRYKKYVLTKKDYVVRFPYYLENATEVPTDRPRTINGIRYLNGIFYKYLSGR